MKYYQFERCRKICKAFDLFTEFINLVKSFNKEEFDMMIDALENAEKIMEEDTNG